MATKGLCLAVVRLYGDKETTFSLCSCKSCFHAESDSVLFSGTAKVRNIACSPEASFAFTLLVHKADSNIITNTSVSLQNVTFPHIPLWLGGCEAHRLSQNT